jgi:meso-butanediol dehydrogenase / (S,S)-butanediol dehydrogenase / diacetyl reductase
VIDPGRRFDGKVALLTGAASGIGRATAVRLAAEGASVVGADVSPDGLAETTAMVRDAGGTITTVQADVSDPSSVDAIVATAVQAHGRIDVLGNIAGILRFANFADVSLDDWNRIMAVNVTGTFLMCQTAMPHLLESGGNIVNISSTAALAGQPWAAAYSASKGAIMALSFNLAVEFGRRGVRTNVVAPGSVETPIQNEFFFPEGADTSLVHRVMALDKPRGPEHIASVVAFVASDDGAHMNGSVIRCDGGTLS